MNKIIIKTINTALSVLIAAYLLDGVTINNTVTALVVAIVLGLLNTFVKPILVMLTIPITVFTLGLFLLVINIIIVKWAANLVPGFYVANWWSALWFSIIVSIFSTVLEGLIGNKLKEDDNN